MPSYQFEIDEKSDASTRFISQVRDELVKAVLHEKKERNLSQHDIAQAVGTSPSVISRQLSGEANLTLRSVAEIAWALGWAPSFALRKPEIDVSGNFVKPELTAGPVEISRSTAFPRSSQRSNAIVFRSVA